VHHINSFQCRKTLKVDGKEYIYYSLVEAEKNGLKGISSLPFSMKVLLENLLRSEDNQSVKKKDIHNIVRWVEERGRVFREISYHPARILMQDFTGVPAIVDLAAMREAMLTLGESPEQINPLIPVDLVVDHSIIVDDFGNPFASKKNVDLEYQRNKERYRFLKWGQKAFKNFRVIPPGNGICHQINLEYLAKVIWIEKDNEKLIAYPDTCVGTDSHTTMINALGVLGWGVGGIEAEAAMLGQAISMLLPEVIGVRLSGYLKTGVTATDLVLTITKMFRDQNVIGKFIEFFGPGLDQISIPDRATISNMAPEYGATCAFFPIDNETIKYLQITGRSKHRIKLTEIYAREQGIWRNLNHSKSIFTDVLELDMTDVIPAIAGPKRPESRIPLEKISKEFKRDLINEYKKTETEKNHTDFKLDHGDVVIAAITSCTNTSNPNLLISAALLARNAVSKGLKTKPWVKTSLAPGSQVVASYLANSGLQKYLDKLGFNIVGFGCTTCIGNSGPLPTEISRVINEKGIIAAAVLSGNRNFEGRISQDVQANYLASPPLVIAYALSGTLCKNLIKEPIGIGNNGLPVFLHEIWPDPHEVKNIIDKEINPELFKNNYSAIFEGDKNWKSLHVSRTETYPWDIHSTYVRKPPYFDNFDIKIQASEDIINARIVGLFGDKITTDHISPAGSIQYDSPAGQYLRNYGVNPEDFNQYGTRRGNHEVMIRGTFANIRLHNFILGENGQEGGYTLHYPSAKQRTIYDAALQYKKEKTPLIIFSGIEYGNGSSRDWAAKGISLLGIRAVIAQSFERIHRSNLIGMGVIPFIFDKKLSWKSLKLKGNETVTIHGINSIKPQNTIIATIGFPFGKVEKIPLICCINTLEELDYLRHGGILPYVLRSILNRKK
jgi:aconitate hydratase